MLALTGILLIVFGVIGLAMHIAGGFIHFILVAGLVMVVLHFHGLNGACPTS